MPIDLEKFKPAYEHWVKESLAEFQAGRLTEIVKKYPLVNSQDMPWTPYTGQASEQTFALVTSGGLYLKNSQPAFDTTSIHGDPSMREIPKTVQQKDIGIAHAQYDHSLAEEDINVIFPIHRLIELEEEKVIGKLVNTNYSFSYVNDLVALVTETVPNFISKIKSDGVDVLLLVPV
jgi:glycine/betaine/sarcosine/D-proline reductase family selenoprotein B